MRGGRQAIVLLITTALVIFLMIVLNGCTTIWRESPVWDFLLDQVGINETHKEDSPCSRAKTEGFCPAKN